MCMMTIYLCRRYLLPLSNWFTDHFRAHMKVEPLGCLRESNVFPRSRAERAASLQPVKWCILLREWQYTPEREPVSRPIPLAN
jgi:hypothetical protein